MHLMHFSRPPVYIDSHSRHINFNIIVKLNGEYTTWWVLSDPYLKSFAYLKNFEMRLFNQLHMSRIVQSAGAQMALLNTKQSINLFHLLFISLRVDPDHMFTLMILVSTKQCMTTDGKVYGWILLSESIENLQSKDKKNWCFDFCLVC